MNEQAPAGQREQVIAEHFSALSQQTAGRVREELRLVRAELTEQGKRLGAGVGLLGGRPAWSGRLLPNPVTAAAGVVEAPAQEAATETSAPPLPPSGRGARRGRPRSSRTSAAKSIKTATDGSNSLIKATGPT